MLFDLSANLTGGIRTSQNKVFGIGAGWGQRYFIYEPELHPEGCPAVLSCLQDQCRVIALSGFL